MKKKGFVFIETIITVVILSSSLLMLYNSYSSSIYNEKERLVYDDVAYIYRANQVRKFLYENSNLLIMKDYAFQNTYIKNIGYNYVDNSQNVNDALFTPDQKNQNMPNELQRIFENFNINQVILVKSDYVKNCFNDDDLCKTSTNGLSDGLKGYLNSLNEADAEYFLLFEFAEKTEDGKIKKCLPLFDTKCQAYYAYLKI